jgi:presenilin-like A22 family membrane protease
MDRRRTLVATGGTVALFHAVQIGALALVEPFAATNPPVSAPTDPANGAVYLAAILVATAGMLAALRYGLDRLLRAGLIGTSALLAWYVLQVVVPRIVVVAGVNVVAAAAAVGIAGALFVHPEWYVIDAAGVLMGAGAAGLFGISFSPLPAVVLLAALAVYDAISVYGTEHMLSLAGGVIDLRVPVVLVVPVTAGYSFLDAGRPSTIEGDADGTDTASAGEDGESPADEDRVSNGGGDRENGDGGEGAADPRDALFVGLGDAVMPAVLVASSAAFAPPDLGTVVAGLGAPTLGAMAGTLLGTVALVGLVARGRAHAGLPLLNGGAIAGYLLGAVAAGLSVASALGL